MKSFKNICYIFFCSFILLFDTALAKTSSKVAVCESPGVLRTLKIIGVLLLIIKILVPLILIIMSIADFGKSVIAGNAEDIKKNTTQFFKRLIASAVILVLPTLLNYVFVTLVDTEDAKYEQCSVCLLDAGNCDIPDQEQDYYEDE